MFYYAGHHPTEDLVINIKDKTFGDIFSIVFTYGLVIGVTFCLVITFYFFIFRLPELQNLIHAQFKLQSREGLQKAYNFDQESEKPLEPAASDNEAQEPTPEQKREKAFQRRLSRHFDRRLSVLVAQKSMKSYM